MSILDDADLKRRETERILALYGENHEILDDSYDRSLAVKCINGTFVGKRRGDVLAFRGIPFVGEQPTGAHRWKPPVEYVADDGVYEAYYIGKNPPQWRNIGQAGSLYPQGEDCLHLNVWTPAERGAERLPVMVWIHGGAFELGSTAEPREEGTNFVHENPDVVLVSIEYRLNILGFVHLSHLPDGADYPDAQNLGLLDQMMALKWVHENIAAFDGDPDNVTIWGESAGGGSVTTLPLIEGSHKYFHRIIAQSGSPCLTRSTEQAIECTNEWMEALGCKTVADLQKVDVDKLVETATTHLELRIWPERDGRTVPLNPYDAWADGAVRDMEILHGCNKDEVGVFIWGMGREFFLAYAEDRKAKKMELLTEEEKALVESYCADAKDVSPDYSSSCRLIDQIVFVAPLFRLSEIQTKAGGAVYTYFFTPESSVPLIRSGHGVELNTVFNHPEELRIAGRPFDETFSKTVRKMWVQFAKCGNPSLTAEQSPDGKAKEWPAYDPENRYMMVLDEFDIHPEREAERKLLDWERTYFLTKHYFI